MNDKPQVDVRGAVEIKIYGKTLHLLPEFRNLARAEQATGKTAIVLLNAFMSGNVSVVDLAKVVVSCAVPADDHDGKLPKPWNHLDVGQHMMDEGYTPYLTAVVTFLGAALTARPKKQASGDSPPGE